MQGITDPLDALNKDGRRTEIEDWLQCAADVDRQYEHDVHHQQEDRHPQPAVEDHPIQHLRQAVWQRQFGVADRIADSGDRLVAGIGNHQRGIFLLLLLQR
ncbi:hypothetical protein D3C79_370630 [compost metagenome]